MSKTVLLFMIPQAFNFLLSCPQLFKFVDCPRHRMPKLSSLGDKIEFTSFKFKKSKSLKDKLGRAMIRVLELIGLAKVQRSIKTGEWLTCNNLTLINVVLMWLGPMKESHLTLCIGAVQIIGSLIGFVIRYGLVHVFYNIE